MTTSAQADKPKSQFTRVPPGLTRQWQRLTPYDILALGLMTLVATRLYVMFGTTGALLGIMLTIATLDQLAYVRTYDYVLFKLPVALFIRKVRGGYIWKAGQRTGAIPYRIMKMPGTDITLVFGRRREDKVSIIIEGAGSPFSSLGIDHKREFHDNMAEVLKKIATRRGYRIQIGWLYRARNWDQYEQDQFDLNVLDPDILLPIALTMSEEEREALSEDDPRRFAYEQYLYGKEVRDAFEAYGTNRITMAVVITISKSGISDITEGIDPDDVSEQPIVKIADRAITQLESIGVAGLKPLNAASAASYFREAWDITRIDEFRRALHKGVLGLLDHWPRDAIHTTTKVVKIGGTYHALLRVTGTPETVGPQFMMQLFSAPVRFKTVSTVTEALKSTSEYTFYGVLIDVLDDLRQLAGVGRLRPKAKKRDEARRENEQNASDNPYLQLYDVWFVVSQESLKKLEDDVQAALDYFDSCQTHMTRVETLEPILRDLTWRALTAVM